MEFMQKVKVGIAAVIAIIALIIIFQNSEPMTAKLLFVTIQMPTFALLLINLGIGFGLGLLTSALLRRRKAKEAQV